MANNIEKNFYENELRELKKDYEEFQEEYHKGVDVAPKDKRMDLRRRLRDLRAELEPENLALWYRLVREVFGDGYGETRDECEERVERSKNGVLNVYGGYIRDIVDDHVGQWNVNSLRKRLNEHARIYVGVHRSQFFMAAHLLTGLVFRGQRLRRKRPTIPLVGKKKAVQVRALRVPPKVISDDGYRMTEYAYAKMRRSYTNRMVRIITGDCLEWNRS